MHRFLAHTCSAMRLALCHWRGEISYDLFKCDRIGCFEYSKKIKNKLTIWRQLKKDRQSISWSHSNALTRSPSHLPAKCYCFRCARFSRTIVVGRRWHVVLVVSSAFRVVFFWRRNIHCNYLCISNWTKIHRKKRQTNKNCVAFGIVLIFRHLKLIFRLVSRIRFQLFSWKKKLWMGKVQVRVPLRKSRLRKARILKQTKKFKSSCGN